MNLGNFHFWSRDLYLHVIRHLHSEFRVNRPIRRRDIAINDIQYDVRLEKWFLLNFHAGNGNLHLYTKFDRNRITHGWNMEIKLFSKCRPSAILNFRKLHFWSRDMYWHVILYFRFKFRINQPICRRDVARKRFSIRRPSAVLNLKKLDFFLSNVHPRNANMHPRTILIEIG